MKLITFLIFLLFTFNCPLAQGAVHTDTHTYIVSRYEHKVLVIEHATGVEKVIEVGQSPYPMVIHGNFGYVVNEHSFTVSVIDLKTQTLSATVNVGRYPKSITFHGDLGYVMNGGSHFISVIDSQSLTVSRTIEMSCCCDSMIVQDNTAYIILKGAPEKVGIIDLKTFTLINEIEVGLMSELSLYKD